MPHKQIPNAITLLRLVIAAAFFATLEGYRFGGASAKWVLPLAILLFIVAAITDAIDGHLARKWQAESRFGRIMDPFCDKVLVIGAFLYLAGAHFSDSWFFDGNSWIFDPSRRTSATGVAPWMVVCVLARELLVTGIRDEMESSGVKFGANWAGKAKLIVQAIAIPTLLAIVWWKDKAPWLPPCPDWMDAVRDGLVWLTAGVTVLSGLPYVSGAIKGMTAK